MKTIVMTGATRGIGAVAARELIGDGHRLIVGARGDAAVEGADSRPLDLADLDSVRSFATGIDAPFDALILNAGLQDYKVGPVTPQGYERTFGVNHLAHYLLLRLLQPKIRDGGTIVLTSSGTHDPGGKTGVPPPRHADAERLAYPDRDPGLLDSAIRAGLQAYSSSKLCNLMTARTLAASTDAKARNLHVYAYDPGFTPGTGLARRSPWFVRKIVWPVLPLLRPFMPAMNRLDDAGHGLAGLADGSIANDEAVYCSLRKARPTWPPPSELARDDAACEKLWRDSARMTGLTL